MTHKEQNNWGDKNSKMVKNPNYKKSRNKIAKQLSKPFYLVNTKTEIGLVTLSSKEASIVADCNRSSIAQLGTGRAKTVHGYTGKYIPKDFEIGTKDMHFTEEQKKHLLDNAVGEITI